jgi:tRNA-dihydrouridine synthase
VEYETAIKTDKFVVIAHGTIDEVARAKGILEKTGAARVTSHEAALVAAHEE